MSKLAGITENAQSEISDAFYSSAVGNAKASDGLLVAYQPDFEAFPYQSLSLRRDRRVVEGNPLPPGVAFAVLEFLDSRCKGLSREIEAEDKRSGSIDSIHQVIDSGQDVIIGTDHLQIEDIAYFATGISSILRSRNAAHSSGVILSKAASDYMGVNLEGFVNEHVPYETVEEFVRGLGLDIIELPDDQTGEIVHSVPVRNFLKLAVDLQFLVIPNTGSFADLRGMQQEIVEDHNKLVKRDLRSNMTRRGVKKKSPLVLYVAAPGTKNKPLDIEKYWQNMQIPTFHETIPEFLPTRHENIQVVGRMASGMVDYMKQGLTYAGTIRFSDEDDPKVRIDPQHISVNSPARLTSFAERLINLINDVDEQRGVLNIYDKKGNIPVVKNRPYVESD